jgi:hypothetical protein
LLQFLCEQTNSSVGYRIETRSNDVTLIFVSFSSFLLVGSSDQRNAAVQACSTYCSMAHRIIAAPAVARRLGPHEARMERLLFWKNVWIVPIVAWSCMYIYRYAYNNTLQNRMKVMSPTTSLRQLTPFIALSILSCVVVYFSRKCEHGRTIAVVALYPLGIQLGSIPSCMEVKDSKIVSKDNVTEIIYSHKVQSLVVLRICHVTKSPFATVDMCTSTGGRPIPVDNARNCSKHESRRTATKWIDVFPGVEMTYMECLMARSQINEYLVNFS